MPVSLALPMRLHPALTPRRQQSLCLLQLSSLEFQQELRQALDANPFLDDGRGEEEAAVDAPRQTAEAAAPAQARAERDDLRPPDGEVSLTAAVRRGTSRQVDNADGLSPGDEDSGGRPATSRRRVTACPACQPRAGRAACRPAHP